MKGNCANHPHGASRRENPRSPFQPKYKKARAHGLFQLCRVDAAEGAGELAHAEEQLQELRSQLESLRNSRLAELEALQREHHAELDRSLHHPDAACSPCMVQHVIL